MRSHVHRHQTCQKEWEAAIKHSGPVNHVASAVAASLTRTNLISIASAPITANTIIRVPGSGGRAIATGLGWRSIEIIINLSTADKEASGNTLELAVCIDPGDTFVSGYPGTLISGITGGVWSSYGGVETVTLPDGTVVTDPDPTIIVSYAAVSGQTVHVLYRTEGITNAGVTVNSIT